MGNTTIESTSDEHVVNNVVRHEYRVLNDDEKARVARLKDLGLAFIETVNGMPRSRETAIAVTKMEEAVMWAVKAATA